MSASFLYRFFLKNQKGHLRPLSLKNNMGFTFVEVLVSVALVGALIYMLLSSSNLFMSSTQKSRASSSVNNLELMLSSILQNKKWCTEAFKNLTITPCSAGSSCNMVPPSLTEFSIQGGAFKIKPNDWIGMNFNPTGGLSLDAVEQAGGFKIDQLKLNGHGDLPTHNFLGTDGNNYSTTIAQFEVSFKSSSSQSAPELPTPLKILVPLTYNNTNAVVACGTQYNENISELRSCIYQFSGGGDTNWRKCPIENQILIGCVGAGNPSLGNIDTSNAGYIGVAPSRMNGDYPTACRARADTGGGVNVTVWLFCMTNAPNC